MVSARALHFVLKIGDRAANANFFRNILGMKVLRHEEFNEGCEAKCNGPYDNRWSKTMIGYGPESTHFVLELTYNYGVKVYEMGNDFNGITIQSKGIIERAKAINYPFTEEDNKYTLKSPDGYTFYVLDNQNTEKIDPVEGVTMNCIDIDKTHQYWHTLLNMKVLSKTETDLKLSYSDSQAFLTFIKIDEPIERKKAFGRIAFAVPYDTQTEINRLINDNKQTILTPLITLATPGKATVRVIILSDPNQLEICFVDEEGFSQLSQVDPQGDVDLDKFIKKDPFQTA